MGEAGAMVAAGRPAELRSGLPKDLFARPAAEVLDTLDGASRRVDTTFDGRKTVFRVWGEGVPLVMIHGGSGSWRHWTRNIPVLAQHYKVVTVDIPGFGDSDVPGEPLSLIRLGEAVRHGIEEILGPVTPYHLTVFSFGGQIASQLIAPHRMRLMSFNTMAPGGLVKVDVPPLVSVRSKSGAERIEAHRFNLGSLMIANKHNIDDLAIAIQEANTSLARIRLESIRNGISLSAALKGLTLPVTAFWGERDNFARGDTASRRTVLLGLQPNADCHVLPGAGHWAMYEHADLFNTLLLSVLEQRAAAFMKRIVRNKLTRHQSSPSAT